jgi:DNA-binding MarR family transcriptional regulator
VLVALSLKGKRLVDQFRKRRRDIFTRALGQLDEKERAQVVASLEKVVGALEQFESKLAIRSRAVASKKVEKPKK